MSGSTRVQDPVLLQHVVTPLARHGIVFTDLSARFRCAAGTRQTAGQEQSLPGLMID